VGDTIRVNDCEGEVDEIELFTTRLNTADNRHLILPNGHVFGSVIHNFSRNPIRRVDVHVGVAHSADIRRTRSVLEVAASVIPGGAADPNPQVILNALGESSVQWQVRVWSRSDTFGDVRERLITAVKEALDAAEIPIQGPQFDVRLVGAEMHPQGLRTAA
jgi:small conductance mechanosensitive channel